jgi:hypothetical protein
MGKIKNQALTSVTYSALAQGQSSEPSKVVPRDTSYEEYYLRWGFLPPGFAVEKNGKVIYGGCPKWDEYADQMGYPPQPKPRAEFREIREYQRWLDKMFRPWVHGDDPIFKKMADGRANDLRRGDWDPVAYEARKRDLEGRPVPPEQLASAEEWLQKAGVAHLPKDAQERMTALAEWGKWYMRQPNPRLYSRMAAGDPNRLTKPKGWA